MRITSVDVSILDVPVERTYTAGGHAASSNWHVLSRVNTEDGVQGIGYAVNTRSTMIRALGQAARELGEHLVGANVLEVEAARARLERAGGWTGPGGMLTMAIATLDIAMWDAAGKLLGQPLYRMLGGYRDRLPVYASDWLWTSLSPDELAQSARNHVDAGYRAIKMRAGAEARPEAEAARARAVREAVGPDVRIMVDAAESWDAPRAMRTGRLLEEEGIAWLEDPIDHLDLEGLSHLSANLGVPIAGGEHLYGVEPFQRTLPAQALHIAIIDLARVGGVTPWRKAANVAEALHIPVAGHVIPEVHVHLLAAIPNGYIVENVPRSAAILRSMPAIEEGELVAPKGPGLGLELDEAAVTRYRVE